MRKTRSTAKNDVKCSLVPFRATRLLFLRTVREPPGGSSGSCATWLIYDVLPQRRRVALELVRWRGVAFPPARVQDALVGRRGAWDEWCANGVVRALQRVLDCDFARKAVNYRARHVAALRGEDERIGGLRVELRLDERASFALGERRPFGTGRRRDAWGWGWRS